MKHLFVPENIAQLARDKGFNEPCLAMFDKYNEKGPLTQTCIEKGATGFNEQVTNENLTICIAAPLYQQLIDWFEEKHNIFIEVRKLNDNKWCYQVHGPLNGDMIHVPGIEIKYESYNEAFKEAFKLIK